MHMLLNLVARALVRNAIVYLWNLGLWS